MSYTTVAANNFGFVFPTSFGSTFTLAIWCDNSFVADDGKQFLGGAGDSLTGNFVAKVAGTVAGGVGTYASFSLPKTDLAQPTTSRYYARIFTSTGAATEYYPFSGFHLRASLGDSITYQAWDVDNQVRYVPQLDGYPTATQVDTKIAAAINAPASTTKNGLVEISVTPVSASNPIAVGKNDTASTSNAGVVQLSADSEATAGKAVQGSDSRLTNPRIVTNGTTLEIYGDSISAGFNASPSSNSYANLVSAQVGWTPTNHGVSGSQCGDQAAVIYTKSVGLTVNENYLLHNGIGDEIHYAADVNKQSVFQACYLAQLYWLAIPDALKLKASNAGITYTGVWAAAATAYDTKFTYVVGATAQATVVGNAVYVGSLVQTGITAASCTINVDGTDYGTFETGPPGGVDVTTSGFNLSFFPVLRRITLPTFGTHLVTVTAITASVGHPVYLTHIAGNGGLVGAPVLNASCPSVYALTILRQSAAGYVTYGGSDARVAIYNQMILDNVELVKRDGFNIASFDLTYTINPETDLDDNLHPNNAGHLKIANALTGRMRRAALINSITGSATLDFTAKLAGQTETLTITNATGAADGDPVALGIPNALWTDNDYKWWVSAASTISVRRTCINDSNPAPATIKYEVRKF